MSAPPILVGLAFAGFYLANGPRIALAKGDSAVEEIAEEAPAEPIQSTADGSKPKLKKSKKSKLATNLVASATKPRKSPKDKPRGELAAAKKGDTSHAKLELAEPAELPDLERIARHDGKLTIGATARVQEVQSQLLFEARVDTGAASCSLHCEEWKIDEESDSMDDNIGKDIRVLISNDEKESQWIDSRIEECVVVKTSEERETRYKVPLTLRWNDFEKEVVVTLNNRGHMNYPLLLGRNFLEGDFVVDIEMGE